MLSLNFIRWLQTINVNLIAATYGLAVAVYGAALVDVAEVYNESIKTTTITLTARCLGAMFSSLIGALVYKYVNTQIVLLGCVIYGGLAAFLTTILPSLMYLHVVTFFIGCTMGFMEIGIHVWIQVLWKERSGSFFHFMNFMFGFGGIIGPFVCEPFLREFKENTSLNGILAIGSANLSTDSVMGNISQIVKDTKPPEGEETRIFTAYCIIAAIYGVIATSMMISYCMDRSDFKPSEGSSYFAEELPLSHQRCVLVLLALYLTVGVTCEIGYATMIFTFAVSHPSLRFTKSNAAFLTSLFWTSYTVSRVVSTGLSLKFSPAQLIVGCHVIYMAGALLTMLLLDTSPTLIPWLGTAILAFGLSPYWSNSTAWSVQYIQLTPGSMALITMLYSSGLMLVPFFLGNQIAENPRFFLVSNTGLAALLTAIAIMLVVFGNTETLRKHSSQNKALKAEKQ